MPENGAAAPGHGSSPDAPEPPADGTGGTGDAGDAGDAAVGDAPLGAVVPVRSSARDGAALERLRRDYDTLRQDRTEMDQFISVLAHDLRTPLTSIRGYAQLMQRQRPGQPALDPSVASGLQTIVEQSDRLTMFTNILLDVSRLRLQRLQLRREPLDLGHLVDAAVAASPSPGVEIVVQRATEGALRLEGDSARLSAVVRTLLDHLRPGAAERIAVHLARVGDDARVWLSRDGEALAPHVRDRLFEQLVEAVPGTIDETSVTWKLGTPELYVARGVVEAHGGALIVESPAPDGDGGLRFSLRLPLAGLAPA